jgi:hypothetical protein
MDGDNCLCQTACSEVWAALIFCAGDALFQTHENLEHLAMMEQVLGPLPESMVERSNKAASKCFVGNRCVLTGGLWPVEREGVPCKCERCPSQ